MHEEISNSYKVIVDGGIILYPTDIAWGIGCDATNDAAVQRILDLKKRFNASDLSVLVNGDKLMHQIFPKIPEVAWQILDFAEKPTTLILDAPKNVSKLLTGIDNSLGVRIVKEPFCFKLIERLKRPLVFTTANAFGMPSPSNFNEISAEVISNVDYAVDFNRDIICSKSAPIIKLTLDAVVKIIKR